MLKQWDGGLMDNIILIGFMGSGKTSVGVKLANRLGYTFCDTDRIIENECNRSISNIFATDGEEYFRKLETSVIKELYGKLEHSVLSVGGGLPITEGNAELLKRLGQVVYLKTSKETILKRLNGDTTRPLLAGDDAGHKVEELLKFREPIYKTAAHHNIITDGKSFEEIMQEICNICRIGDS
jgi:shikimate kinase